MSTRVFRLADRSDIPQLAETLAQSFDDDPVVNWFIRADERREEALRDNMEFILDYYFPAGGVYTSDDCKACSIWIPAGYDDKHLTGDERRQLEERKVTWTTREGVWRLDLLIRLEEEKEPSFNHRELGYIGVRPELQGRGLGSALLRHMLVRLDEVHVPAYLESTNPRNAPFYERNGFRVIDSVSLPGGPGIQFMLRDPNATVVKM